MDKIRITIWNEGRHEQKDEAVKKVHPKGMHAQFAGSPTPNAVSKAEPISPIQPE